MNATARFERWVSHHKKTHYTILVSAFTLVGTFPGAIVYYVYGIMLNHHTPLSLLAHIAFLCGGGTLLVFGLLLGILTGCIYYAVDTHFAGYGQASERDR